MGVLNLNSEDLSRLSFYSIKEDSDNSENTELYAHLSDEQQEGVNQKIVVDPIFLTKEQKKWDRRHGHGCLLVSLSEDE